jgi:hypothetical protein
MAADMIRTPPPDLARLMIGGGSASGKGLDRGHLRRAWGM